ncbi:MAG: choice-of-anchor L domain-containing protein [Bacteroidia bacterium]|nr:choice-of-anchor L domain-containing protein [Bacteroidia bacterium]
MVIATTRVHRHSSQRRTLVYGVLLCCVVLVSLFPQTSTSQLLVRDDIPLEELVRKHFIGEGANVTNITRRGWPRAMGWFDGRGSNIGLAEGILLTSGWVGIAPGPNDVEDASFPAFSGGDADLSALVNRITFDACVLEFDFIPYQDTVSFEYVFASEEYEEYVGSPFNDVFAFFISGPGITGKKNIALVPGVAIPVAINNVNHLSNTPYYVDNAGGATVQYDGFTKVLKAMSVVTPCETYRLKLAITDVQDNVLDSGVFLKKGSFNAGDAFEVRAIRDAYEKGCQPGLFEILRGGEISKQLQITFQLLGNAQEGTDFAPITKTVTFQPGQSSMIIPVDALDDGISDDGEMIILYIPDFCNTGLVRDTLYIWETDPLTILLPDDTLLCDGGDLHLPARITGGTGVFNYYWDGYAHGDSVLHLSPVTAGTYRFHVTDSLTGCSAWKDIIVRVDSLPVAYAGEDTVVCVGGSILIGAPATGGTPPYLYEWTPAAGLSDSRIATPVARPITTTTWHLKVTSASGCTAYDSVTVEVSDVRVDAGKDTLFCRGAVVAIGGEASGGREPYTYSWSPAAGLTSTNMPRPLAKPDVTTTYTVRVRDRNGCETIDSVRLEVSWITLDAGPDRMICPGERVTIGNDAQWSHSPVTYVWSPTTGLDNPYSPTPSVRPPRNLTYVVTATNGSGCEVKDTVNVFISDLSADAGPDRVMCPGEPVQLGGSARGGRPPYSVLWTPSIGLTAADVLDPMANPDTSTWYHLRVLDRDGCAYYDSVRVTVFARLPMRLSASGPTLLCTGDSVTLDAGGTMASYKWNTGATSRNIRIGTSGRYWCEGISPDGCRSFSDTIQVSVTDQPQPVITGPSVVCTGAEVRYSVQDAGAAVYRWSVNGGFILSGDGTREITVRWDSDGSYTVAVEILLGSAFCRGDTMITVSVLPNPRPVISASGPLRFCSGDSVELRAPGGYVSYAWSNGATGSRLIVSTAGRYSVTVTTAEGCTGVSPEVEVLLYPQPRPQLRFVSSAAVCEGDSVLIEVMGDYADIEWNTGSRGKTIALRSPLVVWAHVVTADGCRGVSDTLQARILPNPQPVIVADGPLEFCEGDSVRLRTSEAFASWSWSGGEATQSIVVRASGVYGVRVVNIEGCEGNAESVRVIVHPNPPEPVITRDGRLLRAPAGYLYEWYEDDAGSLQPIPGEESDTLVFSFGVWYRVRVRTPFGCSALSRPILIPLSEMATSTVGLPVLTAQPGEEVRIPMNLLAAQYLREAGVTTFTATIRFNSSMLSPLNGDPGGRVVNGERILDISGSLVEGNPVLSELRLVATLGNASSTPLIIETFHWNNSGVVVTRIDGRFDMPVCEQGGERLFGGEGRLRLAQNHPNPFNSHTIIEYEVIERGHTQIYVLDMLGRRVATLLDDSIEPGAYRVAFDARNLPSGLYWTVLHTPGQVVTRAIRLLK